MARPPWLAGLVRLAASLMIVVASAGCPGGKATPKGPTGGDHEAVAGPVTDGRGSAGGSATGAGAGSGSGAAALPVEACPADACVYHQGGAAYFACLAGAEGICFHFGARCAPADPCMYDAASHGYRRCDSIVEGTCAKVGAACQPASSCAFDPDDGLYHACQTWSAGVCKRWGDRCGPT